MTFYRAGMMRPTNCELCDCAQARWNAGVDMVTCRCGHLFSRHVYRPAERTGEYPS